MIIKLFNIAINFNCNKINFNKKHVRTNVIMLLMLWPLWLTIYNQVNNVNYPKLLELLIGMNGPQKREMDIQPLCFGIISKLHNIL